MGYRSRPRLAVSAGTALGTALVLFTYPGGVAVAYRDAVELPALQAELDACETRRRALSWQAAALADRIALKEALVRDLVAGRATLAEVAGRFAEMNAALPANMDALRARFPDTPDDERMALNVLEFVGSQAGPADDAVAGRLADEFHRLYGCRNRPAQ